MLTINVTEAARAYIKDYVTKENGLAFRLSVKKTGCSGYAYKPEIIRVINPHDQKATIDQDLIIYIDTAWLDLLNNIIIDYVIDDRTGLKQKKLLIINPQEESRCGCGESFHIQK